MFTTFVKYDFFCRGIEDSAGESAPDIKLTQNQHRVDVSLLANTTSFMFPHSAPTQESWSLCHFGQFCLSNTDFLVECQLYTYHFCVPLHFIACVCCVLY